MDDLPKPEQHIDSLPKEKRDEAYTQVALLWGARMQGTRSEKELARMAGFPSVEAMRSRLRVWGLSGMLPLSQEQSPKGSTGETEKREASGLTGEAEELPPVSNATRLFELAIATLESDLYKIQGHRETLQKVRRGKGKLFVTTGIAQPDDEPRPSMQGAADAPDPSIIRLIAVYLLCRNLSVERLIQVMHPDPAKVNWGKLDTLLYSKDGLLTAARKLATNIRGRETRSGQPLPSLDSYEHYWVSGRKAGVSEDEMRQRLLDAGLEESEIEKFRKRYRA